MILYLDSSALLKLYVKESGSEAVRKLVSRAKSVCIHLIGYTEICAALGRAQRMGRVPTDDLLQLLQEFDRDWSNIDVVGVNDALIRRAGEMAVHFGLRGYDSVHLAAAEAVARDIGRPSMLHFVAFDTALDDAAAALGFART
jgi:predicted nucleic acid-binding protein